MVWIDRKRKTVYSPITGRKQIPEALVTMELVPAISTEVWVAGLQQGLKVNVVAKLQTGKMVEMPVSSTSTSQPTPLAPILSPQTAGEVEMEEMAARAEGAEMEIRAGRGATALAATIALLAPAMEATEAAAAMVAKVGREAVADLVETEEMPRVLP